MDGFIGAIRKLFACAPNESVTSQEARPVLNALQLILGCERRTRKRRGSWDTFSEEYVTWVRNPRVNIARKIDIHSEWNSEWPFASVVPLTEECN